MSNSSSNRVSLGRAKKRRRTPTRCVLDMESIDPSATTPADNGPPSSHTKAPVPAVQTAVSVALPTIALLLTLGAAWLRWDLATAEEIQSANTESIRVASEVTISLLSYNPATVDADLRAAETQLTGTFREAYSSLVDDVVIPGARQKQISSTAAVPAASLVSASRNRAMVMVFVDQTTIVGSDAPTRSASSIRVTLDKVDGRWLISDFTPIR